MQCHETHPDFPDQRTCIFQNLLAWQGQLYYVSNTVDSLPLITVAWEKKFEGDQHLLINVVRSSNMPIKLKEHKEVRVIVHVFSLLLEWGFYCATVWHPNKLLRYT